MAGAETINPEAGPLYAPFTAPPTLDQRGTSNVLLRQGRKSIHWHWEHMDFHLDGGGRIHTVTGAEAHVTWCLKTLLTERFMHAVYTHNYGVEFDRAMTGGQPRAVTEAIARRSITEALARHPETEHVGDISFRWQGDAVYITLTVRSRAVDTPFELQLSVDAGGL